MVGYILFVTVFYLSLSLSLIKQSAKTVFLVRLAGFMSSILCCIFVIGGKIPERNLVLFLVVITLACSSVAFLFVIRLPCLLVSRFAVAALLFATSVQVYVLAWSLICC